MRRPLLPQAPPPPCCVLIGCGKAKAPRSTAAARGGALPARELYVGGLFRACYRWAAANGRAVVILSALYGALLPGDLVEPYDLRITDLDDGALARWGRAARRRVRQIAAGLPLVCLAGDDYMGALNLPCLAPLAGLGQGRRLSWLGRHPRLTDNLMGAMMALTEGTK